jgi:hypothetical protein
MSTIPLVGEEGSSTALVRSPRGTVSLCGSMLSIRPSAARSAHDALAGRGAIETAISRAGTSSFSARRAFITLIIGKMVALSDLVVVEIVRRRDLDAAGTECRIHVLIGDDRECSDRLSGRRTSRPIRCR